MIGDIVQYLDGKKLINVVVVKIDGPSDVVCLKQKNGHKFNTTIEYLRPIPITKEFLEKNDFELNGNSYHFFDDDKPLEIFVFLKENNYNGSYTYVDISRGCIDITEMPMEYVHELQNVLRLCKIELTEITLP